MIASCHRLNPPHICREGFWNLWSTRGIRTGRQFVALHCLCFEMALCGWSCYSEDPYLWDLINHLVWFLDFSFHIFSTSIPHTYFYLFSLMKMVSKNGMHIFINITVIYNHKLYIYIFFIIYFNSRVYYTHYTQLPFCTSVKSRILCGCILKVCFCPLLFIKTSLTPALVIISCNDFLKVGNWGHNHVFLSTCADAMYKYRYIWDKYFFPLLFYVCAVHNSLIMFLMLINLFSFLFFLLFHLRVYLFHIWIMLIVASTVSSHAQCAQNWFFSRNTAVRMSHSYRIIYTTWQQFNKLLASNS